MASTWSSPTTRSIRISTLPPVSLRPNRRAFITRVSLNTSRSPGCSRLGQIAEEQVVDQAGVTLQMQ